MCTSNVTAGCPTLVREAFTADIPGSFASRGLHVESCTLLPNYTIILREPRDERYRETGNIQSDRDYTLFVLFDQIRSYVSYSSNVSSILFLSEKCTKEIFSYISLRNNSICNYHLFIALGTISILYLLTINCKWNFIFFLFTLFADRFINSLRSLNKASGRFAASKGKRASRRDA